MKVKIFLLAFLIISISVFQAAYGQELSPNQEKIKALIEKASKASVKYSPEAISFAREAAQLAQAESEKRYLGDALFSLGYVFYKYNEVDSSILYLSKSLKIRESIRDSLGIGACLNRLGIMYKRHNNNMEALQAFNQALEIHKRLKNDIGTGRALLNISYLFQENGDFQNALTYLFSAMDYYQKANYQEGIAWLLFSSSIIYRKMNEYEEALSNVKSSLEIYKEIAGTQGDSTGVLICYGQLGEIFLKKQRPDSALYHFRNALRLCLKTGVKASISDGYSGMGRAYYHLGDYKKALNNFESALSYRNVEENPAGVSTIYKYMGFTYEALGDIDKTFFYLNRALKIARLRSERYNEVDILKRFASLYFKQKQFEKAYEYLSQYVNENEDFMNTQLLNRLNSMETRYNLFLKEKENERLARENYINVLRLKKEAIYRKYLYALFALAITLGLSIFFMYRNKSKEHRLLTAKNEEIMNTHQQLIDEFNERKKIEQEKETLIKRLQDSLSEIKTLSGLLPICSHCKKIRNDKGYYQQLESYIMEHSDATFSHGICPDCLKKYYPDYYAEVIQKSKEKKNSEKLNDDLSKGDHPENE